MFVPKRHERFAAKAFDRAALEECIAMICSKALSSRVDEYYWQSPEWETSAFPLNKTLYPGAAGTIIALNRLAQRYDFTLPWDVATAIEVVWQAYLRSPDLAVEDFSETKEGGDQTRTPLPSFFMGSVGILLARYQYCPQSRKESEALLVEKIRGNMKNPTLETLWAGSGTITAAVFLWLKTKDPIWQQLIQEHFNFYWSQLVEFESTSIKVWNQQLYGESLHLTGAGHGYAGNIFPFLKAVDALDTKSQSLLLGAGINAFVKMATVEGDFANWQSDLSGNDRGRDPYLVQWCHGAPGIIISLGSLKYNVNPALEQILVKAGNLVWQAGPLNKKVSICHGTNGNGFAFLKLFERTGDRIWFDRAESFAMHTISQTCEHYAVWSGDLGLALYLDACLTKDSAVPFLDWI